MNVPAREERWTLTRLLAVRIALVSIALSLILVGIFLTKYLLDTPNLRRLTLESETRAIIAALQSGQDPSTRPYYARFPDAYAFRVYDDRLAAKPQRVHQANVELFDRFGPAAAIGDHTYRDEFKEGLQRPPRPGERDSDRWMLTDHVVIGENYYWIQVAMIGDPAWRWVPVIIDEMVDHVLVPVLTIVPALAISIMLTVALALRPLERISRQAAALSAAVDTGARLTPLSTERLSFEFYEVVTAINAMLTKLEHAFDLQKQFTSDAAHELRTPLAVLLLQLDELPPGPVVDAMRESLRDLAALTEQLLEFAQAEDAAKEANVPCDVAKIARKVCEDLAAVACVRGQVIEFEALLKAVPVPGHPTLIELAIRNLVSNAIKHSPDGTAISVNVTGTSEVVVADRGPGIRNEHKDLVFNRFWRADRLRAGSAGIGLALVRRIADMHGGRVRIEDRRDGGTRFILSLAATPQGTHDSRSTVQPLAMAG